MNNSTDEILKRIQERLDARGIVPSAIEPPVFLKPQPAFRPQSASRPQPADQKNPASAVALTPEQIVSDVFTLAPSQILFIADSLANSVADAMNMSVFAPKIRKIAEESLYKALQSAKKMGKK